MNANPRFVRCLVFFPDGVARRVPPVLASTICLTLATVLLFGANHARAVTLNPRTGTLYAWGANGSGQSNVPAGDDFVAVAAGNDHSLALRADGSLIAWGTNGAGQIDVPQGNDFVAISAGSNHSLALREDGSIAAWGDNARGESNVPAGNDFVAIAAGGSYSVALRADGSLVNWGVNWGSVPSGNDFTAISAGWYHGLALKTDGSVVGWGHTGYGQSDSPPESDFVAISAHGYHSLGLRADGSIYAWGRNASGESNVPETNDFVAIEAAAYHSLALKDDGTLAAWGSGGSGKTTVPEGGNFFAITAGANHNLAIRDEMLPPNEPLIDLDSTWNYVDTIKNQLAAGGAMAYPTDGSGRSWNAPDFNPATSTPSWKPGIGPFGAGNVGSTTFATPLAGIDAAPDGESNDVTTYLFRSQFEVDDPTRISGLLMNLLADDGGVLYINGQEAFRTENLQASTLTTSTLTDGTGAERFGRHEFNVGNLLHAGENSIAFELHQSSLGSSDVGFGLELAAVIAVPEFGDVKPGGDGVFTAFEEPNESSKAYQRGANPPGEELGFTSFGGTGVTETAGNQAFLYHNGSIAMQLVTDQIDLRDFIDVRVSIDVRTWEDSDGSDFESADFMRVRVEASEDGVRFDNIDLVPRLAGGDGIGDPNDQLKALDRGGQFGPFTRFNVDLLDRYNTMRVVVDARNNSATERFLFDNIRIEGTVVPEPSTWLLTVLGILTLAGFARRRHS